MNDWGVQFIQVTNTSPIFKGLSVTITGLIALLFAFWMVKRWQQPLKGGFLAFISLAVFIVLYGLFILILQPHWWQPPY